MRKITLNDVAEKANVSKTTVSMVLNNKPINVSDETRKNILDAAKELSYIPNTIARSLSTKKTNTLGVILPDIENPFFAEMGKAIECTAEELGYNVILCNSYDKEEREEKQTKLLISRLVDGVILASGGNDDRCLKLMRNNKVPFIVVDRYIKTDLDYSGVFCSNEEGIKLALDYLYKKNKRNIAFVRGERGVQTADSRYDYYEKISKEFGIFNKDLIFEGKFDITGGMKATENLIKSIKKIDAILYSSDIMALGGMKILIRKGYNIPKNVSIMGYDNINISQIMEPELTTIAQPIYKMGETACKLIVDIIEKKIKNTTIVLRPKLLERNTV